MTRRDYAAKRPAAKSATPGWVWMLVGLALGLFVAFLIYLNQAGRLPLNVPQAQRAPSSSKPTTPRPPAKPAQEHTGIGFDFYSILPEYEVPVPKASADPSAAPPADNASARFILQAGSFQRAADAEARKAQLALLGLIARIQTVTIDGDKTWHRVLLGPYPKDRSLDKTRRLLEEYDIAYLLLKARS